MAALASSALVVWGVSIASEVIFLELADIVYVFVDIIEATSGIVGLWVDLAVFGDV